MEERMENKITFSNNEDLLTKAEIIQQMRNVVDSVNAGLAPHENIKKYRLINDEWRTRLVAKAGADGSVAFRGFRGSYRLSWRDASGAERSATAEVR